MALVAAVRTTAHGVVRTTAHGGRNAARCAVATWQVLSGVGRRLVLLAVVFTVTAVLSACGGPTTTPTPTPWISNTPVLRVTATLTATPLPTFTPTPSATPTLTSTATLPPVTVGTPGPAQREALVESNLSRLRELARWGRGRVDALAWSPDGSRLAVATPLGVYLYDALTLDLLRYFDTHGAAARLAWSLDGDLLAVAAGGPQRQAQSAGGVQLWSQASGAITHTLPTAGLVLDLAFTADGDSLSVITRLEQGQQRGAQAEFWEPASATLHRTLKLVGGETSAAADLSADGRLLATRGAGGPVRLWRLSDGANLATVPTSGDTAGALAFSPDGRLLAIAYPDNRYNFLNENNVRVWQVDQPDNVPLLGYQLRDSSIGVEGAGQAILSLAWSPDGRYLAAGFGDRITRVWRAEPGDAWRRLIAITLPISIAWSPDGAQLAAGGLETFRLTDAVKTGYSDDFIPGLFDLDLSPDGTVIALAEYSQIELRSLVDGTPLQVIGGMDGEVNQLDYSPDGALLVAACSDGTTRLFRSKDGRYLAALGEPTSPMLAVDFSQNGRWIAAAGEDMRVRVFRVNDGRLMLELKEPYVSYELAFGPNVDQLASLTTNGVVLRAFGGEIQRVGASLQGTVGGVSLHDLVYSPGSEFLALVGNDVIRVVNPATRQDVYSLWGQNGALPWSVAFSPDNAFLAVGWSDGKVQFYWAADGAPLASFQAHPAGVTRLAFTQDNSLLVTLGAEDTLRLWGVPVE